MTTKAAKDAQETMQTFDAETLAAASRGEIDLNEIARNELAQRGLNEHGKWIGFDKAGKRMEAMNAYHAA